MLFIPTRGRPECLKEIISACRKYGMPSRVGVMANGDYSDVKLPEGWHLHYTKKQTGCVAPTNDLLELYPDEPWYGFLNDRARPACENWIQRLIDAIDSGVANSDTYKHPRKGYTRIVKCYLIDGDLVRRLGWFFHPRFNHLFADELNEDIYYGAGFVHNTHVKVDFKHMRKHPRVGRDNIVYAELLASGEVERLTEMLSASAVCA